MLTGMYAPTAGYATVAGKDIRTQMNAIRQDIGICLQHDCLFGQLTVLEHIQFFAAIKGLYAKMDASDVAQKVDTSIKDVALSEKRHTLSQHLSGGMKRKLSVAIAFCGDSKTVLLDEPTSGMVSMVKVASTCISLILYLKYRAIANTERIHSLAGLHGMSSDTYVKTDISFSQLTIWYVVCIVI